MPTLNDWISAGKPKEWNINSAGKAESSAGKAGSVHGASEGESKQHGHKSMDRSTGTCPDSPESIGSSLYGGASAGEEGLSAGNSEFSAGKENPSSGIPPENALKGQGQGQGYKKEREEAAASPPRTHARERRPAPPHAGTAAPKAMSAQTRYAVLLRSWERERGKACSTTSEDPRLTAWAEHGVTDEQLREAYDLAVADRISAEDPGPISAGFLDVFLAKLRQQASSKRASALNAPPRQGAKAAAANWQAEMTALVAGTNQPTTRIIDMGAADVIDNDR